MIYGVLFEEAGIYRKREIPLTVFQVVRLLNKATRRTDPRVNVDTLHLLEGLRVFHAIRLPDGRIWDQANRWWEL